MHALLPTDRFTPGFNKRRSCTQSLNMPMITRNTFLCLLSALPLVGSPAVAARFEIPDTVRKELKDARLAEKEVRLRLRILENVARGKAYFPHPEHGYPETRDSKYWKLSGEGYIPRGRATEAIKDLWRTPSGIQCTKYSSLIMIKAMIDVADPARIAELDEVLSGKVIPGELPNEGMGTLFVHVEPKTGESFSRSELIPGDEVYFVNPYYRRLTAEMKRNESGHYAGQQGYHVFYFGDGKVVGIYGEQPETIDDFREGFLGWSSVRDVAKMEKRNPTTEDFPIIRVRRAVAK